MYILEFYATDPDGTEWTHYRVGENGTRLAKYGDSWGARCVREGRKVKMFIYDLVTGDEVGYACSE